MPTFDLSALPVEPVSFAAGYVASGLTLLALRLVAGSGRRRKRGRLTHRDLDELRRLGIAEDALPRCRVTDASGAREGADFAAAQVAAIGAAHSRQRREGQ